VLEKEPARDHPAHHIVAAHARHDQVEAPVVQEDRVAGPHVARQAAAGRGDQAGPARNVSGSERDQVAALQADGPSPGQKPEKPKPTKYYARQAGSALVAVVPATLADDLAKGMGELRAKRLLEVATYETEGFDVVAAGATKTYAKTTTKDKDGLDKTQWKRTAPDAKDLDTTKIEDALFKMGGVEVAEFVDAPKAASDYGLDAPKLKVTVKAKAESWIELGQKDGAFYARRNGDSAILKLDPTKAEELLKAFSEL